MAIPYGGFSFLAACWAIFMLAMSRRQEPRWRLNGRNAGKLQEYQV